MINGATDYSKTNMTIAEMIQRVRTVLDESSAGFFTDAEVYSALNDAQMDIVSTAAKYYADKRGEVPRVLKPLIYNAAGSIASPGYTVNLPSDYLIDVYAEYSLVSANALKPCRRFAFDDRIKFAQQNTLLKPDGVNEFGYYVSGVQFCFTINAAITSYYNIVYIKHPAKMDQYNECSLPEIAHEPMVEYAVAFLLKKDDKYNESLAHFAQYTQAKSSLIF